MERNFLNSQGYKLESQIRAAFGRVTYTQTGHEKIEQKLLKIDDSIKTWQIVLLAMITGSFLATLISIEKIAAIIAAAASLVLIVLNTYSKNCDLVEKAQEHHQASDLLWKIRDEYVSLLTDFEILAPEEIINKKDELQERAANVYANFPGADSKNHTDAQALKIKVEQIFSEEEIDTMLPYSIRRCTRIKNTM